MVNYNIEAYKVSHNNSVYLVYHTHTMLNKYKQNEIVRLTTTRKTNGRNPHGGCERKKGSTAALFHMVATVTLALSMQITLNGSKQFIIKLTN